MARRPIMLKRLGYSDSIPASFIEYASTCLLFGYVVFNLNVHAMNVPQDGTDQLQYNRANHGRKYVAVAKDLTDLSFLANISDANAIVELDVSNNKITDFNLKEIYQKLPALERINMSENMITKLRKHMIYGLKEHATLNISNNPIHAVSHNICTSMAQLADKKVTIRLYNTLLPEDLLEKMESRISNTSLEHRIIQLSTLVFGILLFVGSIPIKVFSDSSGRYRSYLKPLSISMFALGIVCMAIQPCVKLVTHDIKQSKLFWRDLV